MGQRDSAPTPTGISRPGFPSHPRPVERWGRGSLDVSPLPAGCVCQAGVAWAQGVDKGPRQHRPPQPCRTQGGLEQSAVRAQSAPASS